MSRRTPILAAAAGLTATLATAAVLAAPGSGATTPPTKRVQVKDYAFAPTRLVIARNTRVVFAFSGEAHNVVTTSGPVKFRSPTKTSGTYVRVFAKAGTYKLVCTIHPNMRQTIIVRK